MREWGREVDIMRLASISFSTLGSAVTTAGAAHAHKHKHTWFGTSEEVPYIQHNTIQHNTAQRSTDLDWRG